jgi:hypothetical protein
MSSLSGKLRIPGSAVPDYSVGDNQKLSHARRASESCKRLIIKKIFILGLHPKLCTLKAERGIFIYKISMLSFNGRQKFFTKKCPHIVFISFGL